MGLTMETKKKPCYTRFVSKDNLQNDFKTAGLNYIDSFDKMIYDSNDVLRVYVSDGHNYINFIASMCQWDDVIRKMFLQCYFIAEQEVQGSGVFATYFLAQRLTNNDIKDHRKIGVSRASIDLALRSLETLIDPAIYGVIEKTIRLCGISGNILIRNSVSKIPAIELTSGHKFLVGLSDLYVSNSEIRSESKIVLFDGAIVDIGQIDRIFADVSEKKITCIIIARSFSDDVISTININQARQTLDILPITIDDKLENINVINDIAVCTRATVITAESGIRLSNIDIEDVTFIRDVKISKSKFEFSSKPEAATGVSARIDIINNRIQKALWDDDMSPEDIEKVFIPRVSSLSGNLVSLWTTGDEKFLSYIRTRFSFSIQYLAAYANSGYITTGDILSTNSLPKFIPANMADVGLSVSHNVYNSITTAGGCIAIQ